FETRLPPCSTLFPYTTLFRSLAGYILDFVCLEAKLIVEVDGSQHAGSERDSERDGYVASQGFRTLGFWNDEVELDCDAVCLAILDRKSTRLNSSHVKISYAVF